MSDTETMQLITVSGDLMQVDFPADSIDDAWSECESSLGGLFYVDNFGGTAKFKGRSISIINMSQIIGAL